MTLKLKDIGMIKEAYVKIDGLTVIAGENDTGKSTVGKALYSCIKSLNDVGNKENPKEDTRKPLLDRYIKNLFANQISKNGEIDLSYDNESLIIKIENDKCVSYKATEKVREYPTINKPLLIETPMIWTIFPLIKTVRNVEIYTFFNDIDFQIPPTIEDLYFALNTKMHGGEEIPLAIEDIIGGTFRETLVGDYIFHKNNIDIQLSNTAMGIKSFGILQLLDRNNHLRKGQILILDEPEVHLHPKWQLEMAKIIVDLVDRGVKIVVNSHSPYMIEALERYAEKAKVTADFYLAEDETIDKIENNNSKTLAKIFNKLSAPYETFNQMDCETLKDG